METLGETLVLPPWLEPNRSEIEAVLPKLKNDFQPNNQGQPS